MWFIRRIFYWGYLISNEIMAIYRWVITCDKLQTFLFALHRKIWSECESVEWDFRRLYAILKDLSIHSVHLSSYSCTLDVWGLQVNSYYLHKLYHLLLIWLTMSVIKWARSKTMRTLGLLKLNNSVLKLTENHSKCYHDAVLCCSVFQFCLFEACETYTEAREGIHQRHTGSLRPEVQTLYPFIYHFW